MSTAVLVSTYDSPHSLRATLLGLLAQSDRNFQTIVCDDGSGAETSALLQSAKFADLRIRHVWQPDCGWRKQRVLNLAIAECSADYCIFLDGDCIPRADFVQSHLSHRRPRRFISGSRVNIPRNVHALFTEDDILSNRVFDVGFLSEHHPLTLRKRRRLQAGRYAGALDLLTYRRGVFMGCNASAWRSDILRVNGFDETFAYGSDDRELGVRLMNSGCSSRWLKFSLVQLHLNHPRRPDREQIARNRRRFRKHFFTRKTWAEVGIDTALERTHAEVAMVSHDRTPAAATVFAAEPAEHSC